LVAVNVAGVLTVFWLYLADIPWYGEKFFIFCALPFIKIGAVLNGGEHQPSLESSMFTMFLFLFVIVYAIQVVWRKIVKKHGDHAD
jgi:hypothetical protein